MKDKRRKFMVIDANILFSILLVKQGYSEKLFLSLKFQGYEFAFPEYGLKEIQKYLPKLCEKKGLNLENVSNKEEKLLRILKLFPAE